jgi:hypothetical protein
MSAATKKKIELNEAEAFAQEFGYLKQHKSTSGGRTGWRGIAMSIQSKKTQPLGVSAVIWIDNATCERYGINTAQPGLRFNIYNDDRKVMIETVPPGSNSGVKAIIHANSICMNWHSVPIAIRRDKQLPKAIEGAKGAETPEGVVQLAWPLPEWFFGSKEGAE